MKQDVKIINYDPELLSEKYNIADEIAEQEPHKSTLLRYVRKQKISQTLGHIFMVLLFIECFAAILIRILFFEEMNSSPNAALIRTALWTIVPTSILALFFMHSAIDWSDKAIEHVNKMFSPSQRFYAVAMENEQISCSGEIIDKDHAVIDIKVFAQGQSKPKDTDTIEFAFFGPIERPTDDAQLTLDVGREVVFWA